MNEIYCIIIKLTSVFELFNDIEAYFSKSGVISLKPMKKNQMLEHEPGLSMNISSVNKRSPHCYSDILTTKKITLLLS